MRAAVLRRPRPAGEGPLEIVDLPAPSPGPGEVLLRVQACAVCRTDLQPCEGDLDPRMLPIVPGHQIVGIVEEVGPDVVDPRPGERVGVAWIASTCSVASVARADVADLVELAASIPIRTMTEVFALEDVNAPDSGPDTSATVPTP